MRKQTWITLFTSIFFLQAIRPVFAVAIPSFPSCASPQGSIVVSYSSGTHGIVGSTQSYTGSDTVYRVSDTAVTQCFCAENGSGIQTDWWQATALTESEINILKSQGWFFVPTGAVWGLADTAYVARNTALSCLPGSSSRPVSDNSTGTGGGTVLGESSGAVLGLAATGDSLLVYSVFAAGLICLIIGIRRFRRSA